MGFKIAEAFVEVTADGRKAAKQVADDFSRSDGAAKAGTGFGKKLIGGIVATGIGVAVAGYLKGAIMGASDLNETMSKSAKIFGKQGKEMVKWSKTSAKTLGLSGEAALSSAASFGDMFTQIGYTGKASAKMSKAVVQAAADLGSFSNLDTADVADRMSAAFRGEYDSLQAVIPNINAARVEMEAMSATGKKTTKELTAQDKATAVLAIVTKDGARAMGDFADTSDGLANQLKIARAQSDNLKASFGEALLPITTAVATAFTTTLLPAMQTFVDEGVPKIVEGVQTIMGFFTDFSGSMDALKAKLDETDIGSQLADSFPRLVELGERARDVLGEVWPHVQSIAGSLADASANLGVSLWDLLLGSLELLAPVVETLAEDLGDVAQFMKDHPGLVTGVLGAYTLLRAGIVLTTGVQWALNAAVSANPYVLAATSLMIMVGAGGYAIANMKEIQKVTQDMARSFFRFLKETRQNFASFTSDVGANIAKAIAWIASLPAKAGVALATLGAKMLTAGKSAMAGLGAGMLRGLGEVLGNVRRIASDIVEAAKDALNINSPSRVFRDEVGLQIPAGIGEGIKKGKGQLEHTVRNLVEIPDAPRSLSASGRPEAGGDTYHFGGVTIDATNVEDFTRIVSMLKGLGQTARAGRVQGA